MVYCFINNNHIQSNQRFCIVNQIDKIEFVILGSRETPHQLNSDRRGSSSVIALSRCHVRLHEASPNYGWRIYCA